MPSNKTTKTFVMSVEKLTKHFQATWEESRRLCSSIGMTFLSVEHDDKDKCISSLVSRNFFQLLLQKVCAKYTHFGHTPTFPHPKPITRAAEVGKFCSPVK
jgi:hypothetical protein